MADDVDDLLRRAMTTLDRETPAGYFDELPARTLARLDSAVDGDGEPGDELARERAARTARTASTGPSSQQPQTAPGPRARGRRRWGVALALASTGLVAAVAVMLFNATRMRAGERAPAAFEPDMRARGTVEKREVVPETVQTAPTAASLDVESTGRALDISSLHGRRREDQDDQRGLGDVLAGSAAPGLAAEAFEAGMQQVAAVARRCFPPGPRGSAALAITVSPSGEVSGVTAAPPYAGTSAEDCAARAVKLHRFPSWSGAPQTFRYRVPMALGRTRSGDAYQDAPIMK